MNSDYNDTALEGVAIIGMNCRFPGADNIDELWDNLKNGRCSVKKHTDAELLDAGVDKSLLVNPNYVKAGGHIEGKEYFDAAFFGYTPREAECIDPQHRLFLECAWETFELAGYNPEVYNGLIGVFGGCGTSDYLLKNIALSPEITETLGNFQIMISNDNDFFTSRVSYKLNLKGPSINIQSACSTSLVAVCMGYQNLITYQCDMALCGGSSLMIPSKHGYLYREGFIFSPDGVCRAFDKNANGTVQGEGVGAVLLKRLDEAVADRDRIHAVIKGAAINNDGSVKAGFTAPGIDGQAQVIALAQALADAEPETIRYIEAHGTGTPLGDPIEMAALTKAFRAKTDKKNFCAIGSIKTNIGHLDAAAGVAGLIKTALVLENREVPPNLHFTSPNEKLNIDESPFFINAVHSGLEDKGFPLRAGVSSFGIGGTNSHVILEKAPQVPESEKNDKWKVLLLSAKTVNSLDIMKNNLSGHLERHTGINLSDAAFTLLTGRKLFDKRLAVIARTADDARKALVTNDPRYVFTADESMENKPVIFMFTGQGSQHHGMTSELYANEPDFRKEMDSCAEILKSRLGADIRDILYKDNEEYAGHLTRTEFVQPILFSIEYSLARLWIKRGVVPAALIGHSIGEYAAACIAGVFSLEDALRIVTIRGKLIQSLPEGSMLSVPLAPESLKKYLRAGISIGAINGPILCVASGKDADVRLLQQTLQNDGITSSILHTSHAFHSSMMDTACTPFLEELKKIKLEAPKISFMSNVSGTWITDEEATDPYYWVRHLREPVNFNGGFQKLINDGFRIFLEIGPENTLCSIAKRIVLNTDNMQYVNIIPSLAHPLNKIPDSESMAKALANLCLGGALINWKSCYKDERRNRIPLTTYAFDRKRYWVEPEAELRKTHIKKKNSDPAADDSNGFSIRVSDQTPIDEMEKIMADIWVEILGISSIKSTDNFFDLGGDSLKAAQLIALINKRLGQEFTLTDLFIDPTVKSIAQMVKSSVGMKQKKVKGEFRLPILFPIQPKGTKPPMFIVAGAHENRYFDPVNMKSSYEEDFLRYLSQIIPHIGMDQPLYGFRPKGLDARETPHHSVEEMAASYIEEIYKFQSEGPYLIAGECVGGIVAYEMVHQLRKSGQEVAHLILMDTHCPTKFFELRERYLHIRRKTAQPLKTIIRDIREGGLNQAIRTIIDNSKIIPPIFFPVSGKLRSQRQILLRSYKYQNTLMKYRAVPYEGEATLIVNEEWLKKEPDMGWGDGYRRNMSIIPVPGDHATRLTTYGITTGKYLRDIIKKSWDKYNK
ncbi:MAG TPA: beta-ketoacyl synthase N-terminal-like domain-containing protein [Spirochaetota bacterium]|nr:beta-ketoacyl synthase N-terminal-like domain-containing protein [Spirochaetota bacterium]HPJ34142.1 beta-ketoacyl synthase N-terminal-like domain-containing protein [Spirochaetota bacterium]